MDAFSSQIVGYSISERMRARLAVNALDNAISGCQEAAGCLVHLNTAKFVPGSSFMSWTGNGMVCSMGKVGAAGDNTAMESFFALLQKNVFVR